MPQLNPAPWLFFLLLSWLAMLLIFKMKVLRTPQMNSPTMSSQTTYYTTPWTWPWT